MEFRGLGVQGFRVKGSGFKFKVRGLWVLGSNWETTISQESVGIRMPVAPSGSHSRGPVSSGGPKDSI